jgi:CheY-like chemotaxis protein
MTQNGFSGPLPTIPPFGLIGSIVGLVAMMANAGDSSVVLATIPIALTSTLYGLVFSNFFFLPFAANLSERTCQELLLQRMILDMIMPGISGGETFDRLREISPDTKVLLSSGYSLSGEAKTIMDRGCKGFIRKPFRLENLSRKIREIFDRRKLAC